MNFYLNDKQINKFINNNPTVRRKKSNKDSGMFIDIFNINASNTKNIFTPNASNCIYDTQNYNENEFYIENDSGIKIFDGYLKSVTSNTEGSVNIEVADVIGKYSNSDFFYDTLDRGDGTTTFSTAEYTSTASGYFETPAYAAYHILSIIGVSDDDINMSSLSDADDNYSTASCYIRINKEKDMAYTPVEIINLISDYFYLYLYRTNDGKINFQHGLDLETNSIELNDNTIKQIFFIDPLDYIDDYYIETFDNSFRSASDNSSYGSAYRSNNSPNKSLIIEKGLLQVYDDTSADYIGEYAIDNFHYNRIGVNITVPLGDERITFSKGIKLSTDRLGWTDKYFEIFEIIDNYNFSKKQIKGYEIL